MIAIFLAVGGLIFSAGYFILPATLVSNYASVAEVVATSTPEKKEISFVATHIKTPK